MELEATRPGEESMESRVIQNYTELRVYQLGFESAIRIYLVSRNWPQEEKYSLIDQIRRSSRSVCGNLAEAWRKRRYPASFVSKLSNSDTEAGETEVWLDFARKCDYLPEVDHVQLRDNYDHICRMLAKMMADPESWCRQVKMKGVKRGA